MNPAPDQKAIDALVEDLTKDRTPKALSNGHVPPPSANTPDVDIAIAKLREDPERRDVFDGGTGGYASASEADGRMFWNLAFFCQKDLTTMEEAARKSGRFRPKWDERRNGTTWLRQELQKATEHVQDVWKPSNRAKLIIGQRGNKHPLREAAEEEDDLSPFIRADLAQALRDGVDPPETLVPDTILKGKVHSIYSAGGTGKTFLMLWIVLRTIKQGFPVIIFDMENGLRIIAQRLEQLGVTAEQAELIHYFPFPRMPIDSLVIEEYEKLLEEVDPAMVVFDSWINCLAACGLDENSSVDIAAWADAYSQRARHRNAAVLILDHVPKEGNTARGSGRKRDYVDVEWELRNPQPFNRDTVGRIDLHLRKDREGWLPRLLTFAVGGGESGLIFSRSEGVLVRVDDEGLLKSDHITLEALKALGDMGAFDKEWREESLARKISRATYYRCRDTLLRLGFVEKDMNKFFIKPPAKPKSHEVSKGSRETFETSAQGGSLMESHTPRGETYETSLAETPLPAHEDEIVEGSL